jgi:hypothetical protein
MSALGATSGAGVGTTDRPGGHKHGRPLESQNKVRDPAVMPLVPQKCGRPPGSRNKKTLAALAAAATMEPFGASHSNTLIAAPGGGAAMAVANAAVPAAATSIAGLTGTPLEAAAALVGAAMALGAAPPGLTAENVGSSSRAATGKAKTRPPHPPSRQWLSYIPKHGFTTSVCPCWLGVRSVCRSP